MLFFNTEGPVVPGENYIVPPLERLDRQELLSMIERKRYFDLHAPRQTGKTSALVTLRDELNSTGRYRAAYINVESAQTAHDKVRSGMRAVLSELSEEAEINLNDMFVRNNWEGILESSGEFGVLRAVLGRWSAAEARPLVLMIDEMDALSGDLLISVLRQLRAGYLQRPEHFPQSVILCGVRDVRDYRIHSSRDNAIITGGSAFNIKAKSLRLGDFDESQTRSLLLQHTDETGQRWSEAALAEVWDSTQGQPWLVNALAAEACGAVEDRSREIGHDDIIESREELILRRDTHLDQLADKLREERVKRVIEPLLCGEPDLADIRSDDVQYVCDLGLIRLSPSIEVANPIYREIIPRELIASVDKFIPHETAWYVEDGRLMADRLMEAFQEFFRENSDRPVGQFDYREADAQLLMQAFLQRVVNAGGRVQREYGAGRRRIDILVSWRTAAGVQKVVIECKRRRQRDGLERVIADGIVQTSDYMDRCGAEEGHLVIFDQSEGQSWSEKIFRRTETAGGKEVTVWGM